VRKRVWCREIVPLSRPSCPNETGHDTVSTAAALGLALGKQNRGIRGGGRGGFLWGGRDWGVGGFLVVVLVLFREKKVQTTRTQTPEGWKYKGRTKKK